MKHGRLMFDGTLEMLRDRFPVEKRSLEAMYLALTESNGAAGQTAREDLTQRR
jgi:hypothetical protein